MYCDLDCELIGWCPDDPGQVCCGAFSQLPVQAAVLGGVRVRSAQLGASQQTDGVLPVQRVREETAADQRSREVSEVSRGQRGTVM